MKKIEPMSEHVSFIGPFDAKPLPRSDEADPTPQPLDNLLILGAVRFCVQ
jgi:hypothetical protein